MKRRDFIKKAGVAGVGSMLLNNIPIKLLAQHSFLNQIAAAGCEDRVLVLIQLHGGNDGLNTFVPIQQYDQYYSRRANIALPYKSGRRSIIELDQTLPFADQVGLHPDLLDMKAMYDGGRMAMVQGVSYPRNNGSHFSKNL